MGCEKLAHIELDRSPLRCVWKSSKCQKTDVNWYDYGTRFYDPALGRFHTLDPHAEDYLEWTPYNYVGNNPINLIDPNGMDWYDIDGTINWKDQEGDFVDGDNTYQSLGRNVLVGTHNRDTEGNEEINSATFSLYLVHPEKHINVLTIRD